MHRYFQWIEALNELPHTKACRLLTTQTEQSSELTLNRLQRQIWDRTYETRFHFVSPRNATRMAPNSYAIAYHACRQAATRHLHHVPV